MELSDKIKLDIKDVQQASGNPDAVIKLFTEGYCFEFAKMLERWYPNGDIYFDRKNCHYVFGIHTDEEMTYWDITGRVYPDIELEKYPQT